MMFRLTNLIEHSDSIGFPKSLVCELLTSLRSWFPAKDPSATNKRIEKVVVIFYWVVLFDYVTPS